jgi:hypothetical protein
VLVEVVVVLAVVVVVGAGPLVCIVSVQPVIEPPSPGLSSTM